MSFARVPVQPRRSLIELQNVATLKGALSIILLIAVANWIGDAILSGERLAGALLGLGELIVEYFVLVIVLSLTVVALAKFFFASGNFRSTFTLLCHCMPWPTLFFLGFATCMVLAFGSCQVGDSFAFSLVVILVLAGIGFWSLIILGTAVMVGNAIRWDASILFLLVGLGVSYGLDWLLGPLSEMLPFSGLLQR